MVIQDLQPALAEKKVNDFFSSLGPSISDIEVALCALTFALSRANKRIEAILSLVFNTKPESE